MAREGWWRGASRRMMDRTARGALRSDGMEKRGPALLGSCFGWICLDQNDVRTHKHCSRHPSQAASINLVLTNGSVELAYQQAN